MSPSNNNPINILSTAAILNVNARSVTPELIEITRQVLGDENVHVTTTALEARNAAREVISNNYSLVLPMGGDGTLSCWIDLLVDTILEQPGGGGGSVEDAVEKLPLIGYGQLAVFCLLSTGISLHTKHDYSLISLLLSILVPRGTGNGLGHVVGCWQVANTDKKKSKLSRLNLFSLRKRRRLERTRQLLSRLKDIGDLLQKQKLGATSNDSTRKQQLEKELSSKCSIVEMPMMEVIHQEDDSAVTKSTTSTNKKGDLCFFAGSGFDSLMLHDFHRVKAWSSTSKSLPTFLKDALSSVAGYCVALVALTLPQTVRYGTHKIHVRVTTEDEEALWVDHRRGDFSELAIAGSSIRPPDGTNATNVESITNGGDAMIEVTPKKQHLIYSGTTGIIAASTTPYYGGGLRLFPYARLIPNKLHLRLGRISPLRGFLNIPSIFEGSYREKSNKFGCLDFIGDEFDVEVSSPVYQEYLEKKRAKRRNGRWWRRIRRRASIKEDDSNTNREVSTSGFPFQHSGESMGMKERFRLRVVKQPVKFISFLQPRVIVDE